MQILMLLILSMLFKFVNILNLHQSLWKEEFWISVYLQKNNIFYQLSLLPSFGKTGNVLPQK